MATLFLSYQHLDESLARDLEVRLQAQSHVFKIRVGTRVPGDWRTRFQGALEEAEAVVILLSQQGLGSRYVLGQIGSARVLARSQGQLMLPVLVGDVEVPDFINDVQCFELHTDQGEELDRLAAELNQAIKDHGRRATRAPRIFISHRHRDEPLAAALVSVLEAAFDAESTDIRCTSVKPYALPAGAPVSETLRSDLNGAELVIGLIGPETAESRYVLFELGASWSRGIPTIPALVRGATNQDVPGPLSERHSVSLEDEASCLQLMEEIEGKISLRRREGAAGRVAVEAKKLVAMAREQELRTVPARPRLERKAKAPPRVRIKS